MYNLLIADDEKIVRNGIINNIDWSSMQMNVKYIAENGNQALEIINNYADIDIALLDINMPGQNGLDIAKALKSKIPNCLIVIITGYDYFEYVRTALRAGVYDYILKPITKSELIQLLLKIREHLQLTQPKPNKSENDLINQTSFINLITSDSKLITKENALSLGIEKFSSFAVSIIDSDNFSESCSFDNENLSLFQFALLNITSEILDNNGIAYFDSFGNTVLLFTFLNYNSDHKNIINSILSQIQSTVNNLLGVSVSCGVSDISSSIYSISQMYCDAKKSLDFRLIIGENSIIYYDTLNLTQDKSPELNNLYKDISNINSMHPSEVIELLDEFYLHLSKKSDLTFVKNSVLSIVITMLKSFSEIGVDIDTSNVDIISKINNTKTLKELFCWINTIYEDFLKTKQNQSSLKLVAEKIKDYIKKNYSNNNLTLKLLCNEIHFSPSYISIIFKNEIGMSFVEYLTHIRVEKAKQLLLNTNSRTYKIAEEVGFSTPHYFSLVFKKETGLSPKEFKDDSILKEHNNEA